jgi:ubiquinone/menaquinone biosynthesis C-methylase UbiE
VADGQYIPFDDNSFDGAASITTLEFAEDPQKVISEMARSVKPGGKLFFGVLNSLSPYNRKRQKIKNSLYEQAELFSPEQLSNLLAGFGKVRTEVAGFVPQNQALIWMAPVLEILCRSVNSKKGAFIAAEVRL